MASPRPASRDLIISSRYAIRRKLGSGTMGTVYLARDEVADRAVALKLIRADRFGPAGLELLQREFRAFSSLHHPQIAVAYDFGYTESDRLPFYTREYIEGEALPAGPPRPEMRASPREYLKPFFDLLDALHYLHAHEILHLDIHSGNLIVSSDERRGSVLIDFGLMGPLRSSGSPPIMKLDSTIPPELLAGEGVGPPADLYSVGVLLLERLTGSPGVERRLPREIPGWGPRLTLELERIVAKSLERDPGRRFQDAAAFREALSATLGDRGGKPVLVEPGDLTVGRDPELEAIEEALREAADGRPALLWFEGAKGIGKTRLLTEARLRAQLRGLEAVETRFYGDPVDQSPLLRTLSSSRGGQRTPPAWLQTLAVEHGGSTRERALRAAEAYFAADGAPLVLLLDDLERADQESRILADALLEACAARRAEGLAGRGLAIIVTSSRGIAKPCTAGSSRSTHGARSVRRVEALSATDSRALLRALLRPLEVEASLVARVAREVHGIPLGLRQAARALHAEFGRSGTVPAEVELPATVLERATKDPIPDIDDPIHRTLLQALGLLKKPCDRDELAAATGLPRGSVDRALRAMKDDEVVTEHIHGRRRLHGLSHPDSARVLLAGMSRGDALRIHDRMVRFYRGRSKQDEGGLESLARHLLASGKRREGRAVVMEAVKSLRKRGLLHAAVRLLGEAASRERDGGWRLHFAEETSALHQETGDHKEGIQILEPLIRGAGAVVDPSAIRLRRRLGVHYHRAGRTKDALELFEEVKALADPARDVAELILVETELAEMHTLRGEYARAQEACRSGLDLLTRAGGTTREFRDSMEVMLRASLGHLELRRMELGRAREELEEACRLAGTTGSTATRALILHNLGIVHSHLNDYARARGFYRRAEDLLERRGDRHGVIHAACNLATIAAKLGDAAGAREQLERATRLMAQYPGMRLEFVVELARGMVAHFLGDAPAAIESFERAIPIGRKLGDVQFTSFADVYLAEAQLSGGLYWGALRTLRGLSARAVELGPPILERMVQTRLLLLSSLLGSDRTAVECRRWLEKAPRTTMSLLEAWNDVFLAAERAAGGDLAGAESLFDASLDTFLGMGIPSGARFSAAGLLLSALARGDTPRLRALLEESRARGPTSHKVLSVLEPLCRGEAHLALGALDETERAIEEAAGAIVGLSMPELDWRIEFLRARLAERRGDREGARRNLHRSLHTRDLLVRSLPGRLRARFLGHERFTALAKLATRLKRPRLTPILEAPKEARGRFAGMIGASRAMREVFATIDRLRDQEIPILITGETGTGKELVARALHETGPRRGGPFLVLHAASLPPELFEAELFGHEEGAFTGATEARRGILETLAGGTLLLDEVGNLSPALQAKVLRVLESKVVRPLGGVHARSVDVRFLASSSMDLERLIDSGALRRDLYYRFAGVEIHLPPLRARKDDIPALAEHLLASHAKRMERPPPVLVGDALQFLAECEWPGNVRQLENALVRLLVTVSPGTTVSGRALRALLARPGRQSIFNDDLLAGRDLKTLRRELDRAYLIRLFRETRGDVAEMAAALGVSASSVYPWLRRAGIDIRGLRREL